MPQKTQRSIQRGCPRTNEEKHLVAIVTIWKQSSNNPVTIQISSNNNQKSLINGKSSSFFDRFPIRSPDDVMAMPYPLHLAWPWPQRRPASTAGYSCHDVFDGMKPGNVGTAMLQTTHDWDGDDWGMVY